MELLISYEKHHTGNYLARYKEQEIVVLPGAFRKITGVSPASNLGLKEVSDREIVKLGFILKK